MEKVNLEDHGDKDSKRSWARQCDVMSTRKRLERTSSNIVYVKENLMVIVHRCGAGYKGDRYSLVGLTGI